MNKIIQIVVSFIIIAIMTGCGMSSEDISKTVKSSMQETLSTNSSFKEYNLTVENVHVLKKSDNTYKGLASVLYKGSLHDVPVEITVDGENVMWEASPNGFAFIVQEQLKNIFK